MARASERGRMVDDQYRGLLTKREREILSGEADVSDNYRYRVVSRVRTKIENIEDDVEVLARNRDDLLDELRDIVCEDAEDDDIAESDASEDAVEPVVEGERTDTEAKEKVFTEAAEEIEAVPGRGNLVEDVRTWLEGRPPKTTHGKGAVLAVFSLLRERGTTKTGELKDELWEHHSDDYGSQRAMWESVSRYLEDVPGIEKGGYGEWTYSGDATVREELSGENDE